MADHVLGGFYIVDACSDQLFILHHQGSKRSLSLLGVVERKLDALRAYAAEMPAESAWIARFSFPAVALLFAGSWLGGDL